MYTFHSDLCGSYPSYENSLNSVTDTSQAVKVVENGIRIYFVIIIFYHAFSI